MIVGPPAPSDTMPNVEEHLGQIARHARAMGRAIESIDPNNQGPQGPPGVDGTDGTNGTNGTNGTAATIAVGTVGSTTNAGTTSIVNSGTSATATFDFVLRDGPSGANGTDGAAATVSVGTTGSVPNTGTASVVNSGSSSAATLDFVLRDGAPGTNGTDGIMSSITQGGGIIVTDPAGTSPTVAVNPALTVDSLTLENGGLIVNNVNNQVSIESLNVKVGTGLGTALLKSLGAHSLVLATGGTASGVVSIEDGPNSNVSIFSLGTGRVKTSSVSIQGSDKYLNFNSTQDSSGYGIRDLSGDIEVKNLGGNWGQPYHSGMASGSVSFFEGSTSFNARGSTFTFTHGLSVAAQGCPRIIQAYLKRVAAGTVRGIPQYDWVSIYSGVDYENTDSGCTIRSNASSVHIDVGTMDRGITIIAPDNHREYIVPIDGSFDLVVRAWL